MKSIAIGLIVLGLMATGCGLYPTGNNLTTQAGNGAGRIAVKDYAPPQGFGGYILSYFTGNGAQDQKLALASSTDGKNWTNIVSRLQLTVNGSVVCLRDPYIVRKMDGTFVLIASHSDTNNNWGWGDIYVWDSTDLVTFTNGRTLATGVSGGNWAPECIWDNVKQQYLIYFSNGENTNGVYCCYTSDFVTVNSLRHLINLSNTNIDGDMTFYNGTYYLFLKSEATWLITEYKSTDLINWTTMSVVPGSSHEGPACIPSLSGTNWMLYSDYIYDHGSDNSSGWLMSTSSDLINWTPQFTLNGSTITYNGYSLPGAVRHGNAVRVTTAELNNIKSKTVKSGILYKIKNVHSGTLLSCLTGGILNSTPCILYSDVGATDQFWMLFDQGNGYSKIENYRSSGLLSCMTGGTTNGTVNIIYQDVGASDQQWQISAGTAGGEKMINLRSGRAASCNNAGTANNTLIHLWDYLGNYPDQDWILVPAGNY